MVLSLAAHVAILFLLLSAWTRPPNTLDPPPMVVALVDGPPLIATAAAGSGAQPATARPAPQRSHFRPRAAPSDIDPLPAGEASSGSGSELSAGQLAGAASADSGPSGGACDMARRLQGALRKDPLVQAAVAGLGGKAVVVWDGDWVQSRDEDGKGLAAVREAILWEIGFAPQACRAEPVRGLVLLSTSAGPGAPRLAIGSGEWRWSDLLAVRAADPLR